VQLRKEDRLVREISEKELTKVIERRQQHRFYNFMTACMKRNQCQPPKEHFTIGLNYPTVLAALRTLS
jgi:hypothetical protein